MGYKYLSDDRLRDLESIKKKFGEKSFEFSAVNFIRNRCEKLRFDESKENEDGKDIKYTGKSTKPNQIPYNMEKDIDRYTFENSIINFLYTGKKEDAYNIFYCFLEMFIGDYNRTESMVELLSEYESNGSRLLMKHRDHYSHSAFVFILGLAIFDSNAEFRNAYNKFYKLGDNGANHFLEYWGLTSLFHDIGYPFELPFEQLESYFEVDKKKRKDAPFLAYSNLRNLIKIDRKTARKINDIYKEDLFAVFEDTNELFAYAITYRLAKKYYFTKAQMTKILSKKPCNPEQYNYYMDHAYFSANLVFQKLFSKIDDNAKFTLEHIDAMTAIILHNSLYKFSIADYKNPDINIPLSVDLHPLAYLLMLCDELQCWDRTAYGRESTKELHPVDANIYFDDDAINVSYVYNYEKNQSKIDNYIEKYDKWLKEKPDKKTEIEKWYKDREKMKAFASMYEVCFDVEKKDINLDINSFQYDIEQIVDTSKIKLNVRIEDKDEAMRTINSFDEYSIGYLSDSNFTNMNNFAEILHIAYNVKDEKLDELLNNISNVDALSEIDNSFSNMSLEYKIFNINKAKAFPSFLDKISCFYTNKSVGNSVVKEFFEDEKKKIAILSHRRWLIEKYQMGWRYGNPKDDIDKYKNRIHNELIENYEFNAIEDVYGNNRLNFNAKVKENYNRLNEETKGKYLEREFKHINLIIPLLRLYEGLGIYCLKKRGANGYIDESEDELLKL